MACWVWGWLNSADSGIASLLARSKAPSDLGLRPSQGPQNKPLDLAINISPVNTFRAIPQQLTGKWGAPSSCARILVSYSTAPRSVAEKDPPRSKRARDYPHHTLRQKSTRVTKSFLRLLSLSELSKLVPGFEPPGSQSND